MSEFDNYRKLDIWIYSNRPSVVGTTNAIMKKLDNIRPENIEYGKLKRHLRLILTDLYVVHSEDPKRFLSYSRNDRDYKEGKHFAKIFLNLRYVKFVIDYLISKKYIIHKKGFYDRDGQGRYSRMRATENLLSMFRYYNADGGTIIRRVPPVILRNENKRPVDFDTENLETKDIIRRVNKINRLLKRHEVGYDESSIHDLEVLYDFKACVQPRFQKYVRIFNNSNFFHGGRWYCHFSQMLHSENRRYITIDGNPTVELDYSCLHIMMLYGVEGLTPPDGDLYNIPGIPPEYRKCLKKAVNIMINASPESKAIQSIHENNLEFREQTGLPYIKPKIIIDAVKEAHPLVSHHFCTGCGVYLQRLDSLIAARILDTFAEQDICCLSIHDSFIVETKHKSQLEHLMKEYFFKIFKFYPRISCK